MLIAGRFELGRPFIDDGIGRLATHYRAKDLQTDRDVVVRLCDLSTASSFDALERLEREADLLRGLSHPQIPALIESGQDGAHSYLVLEPVDGISLVEEMAQRRYHETEVLDLIADVLPTLAYLHGLSPPVVHRDLRPSSLVRRRSDGRLILIDLGAAHGATSAPELTSSGTFGYMAPEQMVGMSSPASDLYGLGVIALRLLTRREPAELMVDTQLVWESELTCHPATRSLLIDLLNPDPGARLSAAQKARERVERVRVIVLEATQPTERRDDEAATEMDLPSTALLRSRAPKDPQALAASRLHGLTPRANVRAQFTLGVGVVLMGLALAWVIWGG